MNTAWALQYATSRKHKGTSVKRREVTVTIRMDLMSKEILFVVYGVRQ